MSSLTDLPPELLVQILEAVGSRELGRGKGAAKLCVCQHWYIAARPVYLSGLKTRNINIFGHNIKDLDNAYSYSDLRPLMHKNTRKLRFRLLVHYWDENTAQANNHHSDADNVENEGFLDPKPPDFWYILERWRDRVLNPRL